MGTYPGIGFVNLFVNEAKKSVGWVTDGTG